MDNTCYDYFDVEMSNVLDTVLVFFRSFVKQVK